jgi:hypothetical protein
MEYWTKYKIEVKFVTTKVTEIKEYCNCGKIISGVCYYIRNVRQAMKLLLY